MLARASAWGPMRVSVRVSSAHVLFVPPLLPISSRSTQHNLRVSLQWPPCDAYFP